MHYILSIFQSFPYKNVVLILIYIIFLNFYADQEYMKYLCISVC